MPSPSMKLTLPENTEVNRGQDDVPLVTFDERASPARWFNDAVDEYEAAKNAAIDVGVSEPYLSKMRDGGKPIAMIHVARLRKHPPAFDRFIQSMAIESRLKVELRLTIEMSTAEARALDRVRRRMGPMWPCFARDLAAQDWGCTFDLLDAAITGALMLGR